MRSPPHAHSPTTRKANTALTMAASLPTKPPARKSSPVVAQTVAHARLGDDEPRARRIVFDLAAQAGHVDADVMGLRLASGAPDLDEDLPMREQSSHVPG